MAVFAGLGIAATIVVPLVTKAVIDGPIADSDRRGLYALGRGGRSRLGVVEAVLMFVRRWVVSKATLGVETDIRVELYAKLQRLPMGFHGRWESGQLLSRIMSDLSTIRRFLGFGLLFIVVNIAADRRRRRRSCCTCTGRSAGGAGLDGAGRLGLAAHREGVHPAVPRGPGPDRRRRLGGRGGRARHPGHQVVRPGRAHRSTQLRRPQPSGCTTPRWSGSGSSRSSGPSSASSPASP